MRAGFWAGRFRVEPDRNRVLDRDTWIHLEPKAMEVLCRLAAEPGQVVSKEALLRSAWRGTFVTDQVLIQSIWQIRRAVGDDAQQSSFIETVPKRGYRLVAPVSRSRPAPPSRPPLRLGAQLTYRRPTESWVRWSIVPVFLSSLAGVMVWLVLISAEFPAAPEAEPLAGAPPFTPISDRPTAGPETLDESSTTSVQADIFYQRGLAYLRSSRLEADFQRSLQMFDRALDFDFDFAPAWAGIVEADTDMYQYYYDRSESRLARARAALRRVFQLNPDLPEGHLAAAGYYYRCLLDYPKALQELDIARHLRPADSDVYSERGAVMSRSGNFESALGDFRQAVLLSPGISLKRVDLAETLFLLGRMEEAEQSYLQAINLQPDLEVAYAWLAILHLQFNANTGEARRVLKMAEGLGSQAEPYIPYAWMLTEMYDGDYPAALERLEDSRWPVIDRQLFYYPLDLLRGRLQLLMGRAESARKSFQRAREELLAQLREKPLDSRLHGALAIASAGLGLEAQALAEGNRAVNLLPIEKDAFRGPLRLAELAECAVLLGRYAAALEGLEKLAAHPSFFPASSYWRDPRWLPLRSLPRFRRLIEISRSPAGEGGGLASSP